jgi:hypothetical protein
VQDVHLVAVGVAHLEAGLAGVGRQAGVDAVGVDLAHAPDPAVLATGPHESRVLGDVLLRVAVRVEAGRGLEDEVEEGHLALRTTSTIS